MKIHLILFALLAMLVACSPKEHEAESLDACAKIYPDYAEVTVPCNIAPLRFRVMDCELSDIQAVVSSGESKSVVRADGREISLSPKADCSVCIQGKNKDGKWKEFLPFNIYVSSDSIDPYLAYRLIEPGYEVWNKMGIYQRCLESFEETAILENTETNGGCMNCHSFNQRNSDEMLFHLRVEFGGTYLVRNGEVEKLNNVSSMNYN